MRPHLEYCNTVTYPVYEKDAKLLEGVQRIATKMVPEMKNYDYANRLKKLALPSLGMCWAHIMFSPELPAHEQL